MARDSATICGRGGSDLDRPGRRDSAVAAVVSHRPRPSLSLHTLAAQHARQLLGSYSQFGWNHPGPLPFYLMAPLYWLSGYHEASHRVTALLINAASLAGVLWLARRHVGGLFATSRRSRSSPSSGGPAAT